MRLYDAHTHLNDEKLFSEYMKYFELFIKNSGKWMVNIWVNDFWNQRVLEIWHSINDYLTKNNITDFINWVTIWYHPEYVWDKTITKDQFQWNIQQLKSLYESNKSLIFWIWECGIDIHYEGNLETLDIQKDFFAMHLDLCQELNLPIVIHSRDDFYSTFDVLQNYRDLKIYFHCWGYWPDEIRILQSNFTNLWIWFAGNFTYPKAQLLRDSIKITNLDSILMETDAPYLSPQKIRWEINHSSNIKYNYDYAIELLWINEKKFYDIIESNFKKLYIK